MVLKAIERTSHEIASIFNVINLCELLFFHGDIEYDPKTLFVVMVNEEELVDWAHVAFDSVTRNFVFMVIENGYEALANREKDRIEISNHNISSESDKSR